MELELFVVFHLNAYTHPSLVDNPSSWPQTLLPLSSNLSNNIISSLLLVSFDISGGFNIILHETLSISLS